MNHSAFAHLPVAVFAMVPELAALRWPDESRATCQDCAVGAPRDQLSDERPLDIDLRCCTYHPSHPNWLVGRALQRGDEGSIKVRARIEVMDDGVGITGIAPPKQTLEIWRTTPAWQIFGQDPDQICPYFIGGTNGCGVWRDRGSVCRTWFCRHTEGPRGRDLWRHTHRVLRSVERRLAAWCIIQGTPPDEADWSDPDALDAWYRTCADMVQAITPAQAMAMRDGLLEGRIEDMQTAHEAHQPPLPDYPGPRIGRIEPVPGGGFAAVAASPLDLVLLPDGIFQLLSRLDGHTHWEDAVSGANEALSEPRFDRAFLEMLFRRGLIEERDPLAPDPLPGMSHAPPQSRPIDSEDHLV